MKAYEVPVGKLVRITDVSSSYDGEIAIKGAATLVLINSGDSYNWKGESQRCTLEVDVLDDSRLQVHTTKFLSTAAQVDLMMDMVKQRTLAEFIDLVFQHWHDHDQLTYQYILKNLIDCGFEDQINEYMEPVSVTPKVFCPICEEEISVRKSKLGKYDTECPTCGKHIIIEME